jgi:hypothetical protein
MPDMTRDNILIQQMKWHQAVDNADTTTPKFKGVNLWTPLGSRAGRWMCWQFGGNPNRIDDSVYSAANAKCVWQAAAAWACDVKEGKYFYAGVSGFSGTGWSQDYSSVGFTYMACSTSGKTLAITVPAGTKALY